ncbi:hypothetical protein CFC21_082549 [Triticum aestivum]|uniref:C2 domain-containing protein n=2 Tax=Triticum aestivum TaxID=4565 RepID=A0A3B6NN02_WHEAT|nr:protein SRC2 homolog [Triticum dicoccoides]XP_044406208.1 protein SRC2 homolog [Triticum aestivum]KAF7078067.1 hypothetical protein CFC21_082549 [Triticum aestivum]
MGSRYEVEVTVGSARDLKNVNWRNGDLQPYAVLWVDDGPKCSSRVDVDNGESPEWDEKLTVPLPPSAARLEDAVLHIDVVHAGAAEGTKPLVGSARLPLRDVLDDAGLGGRALRSLRLKRPSGRPQGRLDVRVAVREAARYYDPAYTPPAYGQSQSQSRDPYAAPAPYGSGGYGYGQQQQQPYAAPPSGYPAAYGAAAPPQPAGYPAAYGGGAQPAYGAAAPAPAYGSGGYGSGSVSDPAQKKKGMGMGAGLAVGAAAGVLGGLALAEGASYLEDKFEDDAAEKVEDDLAGGGGYDDDDY